MGRVAMARRVRCIPSADSAFCDAATTALAELNGLAEDAIEVALSRALLPSYPRVEVHRQAELARVGNDEVWYAYRDGRPVEGTAADPN
jgi:hypothetical protein